MCLTYIRNELNEANRLNSIINSAMWIMYGHLLVQKQTSIMSTDIIHNYLTNVVRESFNYCLINFCHVLTVIVESSESYMIFNIVYIYIEKQNNIF